MPDLHGWITQQIEETERLARRAAELCGCHPAAPSWIFGDETTDGRILVADDPHPDLKRKIGRRWNRSYEGLFMAEHIVHHDPAAALRRCEADRRILARHQLDPDVHYEPACKGCGTYGDMELPETDNLNECPELLDLAYAHGLTNEILASLDKPVPPPTPPRPEPSAVDLSAYMRLWTAQPTSSVPPALRGPNWKAQP
ncbi:DUF6221 family protein [Streptomyces sp. SCL15-4]|uniref:DUF6221 family protein n=1 Tax=Streptomyces sp. SCL15-4 TaxID=2967221 RepID=UPI002966552E|nr:DUF6221 family protein [Streptomyces sp. SCL15-4]